MPTSFKHEGDDRVVIDNRTGEVIADAGTAQTSAYTGPSYTAPRRGLFGRKVTKTIRGDIRIESAFPRATLLPAGIDTSTDRIEYEIAGWGSGRPTRLHNLEAGRRLVHRG